MIPEQYLSSLPRLMKKLYIVLIPLFALALLVGCSKNETDTTRIMDTDTQGNNVWNGKLLSGKHTVTLKTSEGDIVLELDADAAPKTVTNFIALAKMGYYNKLTFHRVIPDFMIQGGDPNGDGTGGESVFGGEFEDEINADSYSLNKQKLKDVFQGTIPKELENATVKDYLSLKGYRFNDDLESLPMKRGYIAMANSGPNTNGSQFFIITRNEGTPWLEGNHTVFGRVTEGMETVDAIVNVKRGANDRPIDPVTFDAEVGE